MFLKCFLVLMSVGFISAAESWRKPGCHRIGVLTIIPLSSVQAINFFRKREQAAWRIECELGVISDPECPIDGSWASWAPWSPCHGPCDDVGHRRRTRQCINPPPSEDGLPCSGPDEELQPCYLTNCSANDYRKLVEGDATRLEAFHQLEAVPALMERCLQIECDYEAIETALAGDNTWQLDPEVIWNSLQCVKHNLGCPLIGEWGSWGAWSACGARCGRGLRWRLRRCDTPLPSNDNLLCSGTPLQSDECEGDQCALDLIDLVDANEGGQWSNWSQWSPCSEKCGAGVRRRTRYCLEKSVPRSIGTWGTHCIGQHDEFEVCESNVCVLDGGWSGWGAWGPCSQTCGAGKRSRTRSCTRPVPAGGGKNCMGSKMEHIACYLSPCDAYTHFVVILNGDSYLHYNFERKRSALFHFYIRFMPLSSRGILVRRGTVQGPHVRLSLQKWHLCLDAGGTTSCSVPRTCSPSVIEPAVWHTALVTVTNEAVTIRLNDAVDPIKASFSCNPELPDDKMNIVVGEKFHGVIQEMLLNFMPLEMVIARDRRAARRSDFYPSAASNIAFEKASTEEAFLLLHDDQYLRLPCFDEQGDWLLELTIKSKRESGTLLFLRDDKTDSWLHMGLQNMRLKLAVAIGDFRSEVSSSTECPPAQWLDIMLEKKRESNTIKASINSGEYIHVVLEESKHKRERKRKHVKPRSNYTMSVLNSLACLDAPNDYKPLDLTICDDEFFIGGMPAESPRSGSEYMPFSGIIASISINSVLQDLRAFDIEMSRDNKVQLSSRTASISGSYHETSWGSSNRINLTCLHARTVRSPNTAHWLYCDTTVTNIVKDKAVRSVDDGRVLRLVASATNDLRGFYTCRAHANKYTRNIISYGVIGKTIYNLSGPDTTTAIAVITTVLLVLTTLSWLIYEGYHDLRTGFGFFRDAHFTPEEEAEAVCKYIDDHMHLVGSKSAAQIAKARARQRGAQLALASKSSFAAQEPQGLMQFENQPIEESEAEEEANAEATTSEPDELPALPENPVDSPELNQVAELMHIVYRCEPSYVSSPRHGSLTSPRTKLSSTSSFEMTSPRFNCNRLLLARKIHSPRESISSWKKKKAGNSNLDVPRKSKPNLATIQSSRCLNMSPGQKILQKFQQLKIDD